IQNTDCSFSNIERFNIIGSAGNDALRGFGYNDILMGGDGNDTIDSNAGDDLIDGGIGADTLIGGAGNDTYTVDNTGDVVTENASEGVDTVKSSVSYTLKDNFENLILTGTASINGTGNSLNNQITGNAANNILNGGIGADKLIGGDGNDTYSVDNLGDVVTESSTVATQIDTVQSTINYTLAANVENLTLISTAAINGTGNTLSNTLTGNSGNNILNGGIGADTLNGGAGIDTASYSNAAAAVNVNLSNATAGTTGEATGDVLNAIENLLGSNFNDILIGNSTANILNGGTGADKLTGGTGNDVYVVDNTGDIVSETSTLATEIDTVQSAINYSLGANLEKLTLTGTTAINGIGNSLNNTIIGNAANNILNGGIGADQLSGGMGNDTYIVDVATDVISEALNAGIDSVQSSVSWTLAANVENLTLLGTAAINGTGNTLNNTLTGNSANNSLNGGLGNDTLNGGIGADNLIGGDGNDTYVVDNIGDVVTETSTVATQIDAVQSYLSYSLKANVENLTLLGTAAINATGNTLNNTITGNIANNIINGGAGSDTLIGGLGNDTYIVDVATDVISEAANAGTDTVQSSISKTLGANVENLTLTGTAAINATGNTLNNILTGNGANNILNGGAGSDTLNGGLGNDTYIIENAPDLISEAANAGIDTVQSSISWILGNNLENLALTGTGAINGTGNTLNNTITGNAANNTLSGGAGNDILIGGTGNDIIVGDFGDDILTGGGGSDRFSFNSPNEKVDKITDFLSVDDTINIKAAGFGGGLSANAAILATQFFSGAGVTTASNATQRFLYNTTSGALFFDADGNGTGAGALQIATLTGNPNITTADIFVIA
ncbi:MAG: calcium-binding protein, partial [Crinalium sp.]